MVWDGTEMKKEKKGKEEARARGGSCKKKGGASRGHVARDKQAKNKGGKNARVPRG